VRGAYVERTREPLRQGFSRPYAGKFFVLAKPSQGVRLGLLALAKMIASDMGHKDTPLDFAFTGQPGSLLGFGHGPSLYQIVKAAKIIDLSYRSDMIGAGTNWSAKVL
jgi:hypothetical protein